MELKIRTLAQGYLLGAVAVVIFGLAFIVQSQTKADESAARVSHTHEVIDTTGNLYIALLKAETGQRGFLLTGNMDYLAPYREGSITSLDKFNTLKQLTIDNPSQQDRIHALGELIAQKLAELQSTVSLESDGRRQDALAIVRQGTGIALMQEISDYQNLIVAEEKRLLAERETAAITAQTHTMRWYQAASFLLALMSALFVLGLIRKVIQPIERLTEDIDSFKNGALDKPLNEKPYSHEAGVLIRSFNSMVLALTQREKELREAINAKNAKGIFLATMSHEIRTPMNGILGMLKLLQHTELTTRQLDYVAKAEGATKALLDIINDILDYSKVEAGRLELNPEPTVLGEVMRELSVLLSANLGHKNVEVLFALDAKVPPVIMADGLRLRQILLNLAGNAIKFTERGEVVVGIRLLEHSGDAVELEFFVRDTGIGIPADKLGYIFEGFSQAESSTARRFGGTGLGLAISQRLVALMGGMLKVESEYGKGSRFFFAVRLSAAPSYAGTTPGARPWDGPLPSKSALQKPGGDPLQVLIVDDHALAREILQNMAASLGWQVESSGSAEDALKQLQQLGAPRYDLILMDWRMPAMDGWDATRKIRQLKPDGHPPVVIMVTAAGRELLCEKPASETDLIDGYLVKPITASMLYEAVAEVMLDRGGTRGARHARQATHQLAGLHLLVVDDNLLNQQIAQELLERNGARVSIAAGGLEGVAQALAANPAFDAILMDMQMPDIDGLEATRRLRAEERMHGVPIIAMTANARMEDKQACHAAGMVDHVAKPIDLDVLISTILRHVIVGSMKPLETRTLAHMRAPLPLPLPATDGALLDIQGAVWRLDGSLALYNKVASAFRADAAGVLSQLEQHIHSEEYPQAQGCAHTLKGLAGTVGAQALAALADHAELMLKRMLAETGTPDKAALAEASNRLSVKFAETLAALPQAAPLAPKTQTSAHGPATLADRAALQEALDELALCLKRRDMHSTRLGDQLREQFGSASDNALQGHLDALGNALQRLDFAEALHICTVMQEELNQKDAP